MFFLINLTSNCWKSTSCKFATLWSHSALCSLSDNFGCLHLMTEIYLHLSNSSRLTRLNKVPANHTLFALVALFPCCNGGGQGGWESLYTAQPQPCYNTQLTHLAASLNELQDNWTYYFCLKVTSLFAGSTRCSRRQGWSRRQGDWCKCPEQV